MRVRMKANRKENKETYRRPTMKSTLNSLIIAAAVTLSAAAAYGQQTKLTVNVPFAFKTASGMQAAGEYAIKPATASEVVMVLENRQTGRGTMLGIGAPETGRDKDAKLVFRCGDESGCALTSVWVGDGRGWSYKAPKLKPSENERIAVVYFDSNKQAE
jgi:hypothetical protein